MNKTITLFLFLLCYFNAYSQKTIEVSDNKLDQFFYDKMPEYITKFGLEDLRNSTDSLRLRIWSGKGTIEVTQQNGVKANLTQWTMWQDPIINKVDFKSEISKQLLDTLLAYDITTLPADNTWGIDGSYIHIEVSTPEKYRTYTYWSPRLSEGGNRFKVAKIERLANSILNRNKHFNEFIETLPPGGYGLSSGQIDCYLPEGSKESSLYQEVKKRMQLELGITENTSHTKFPQLIIDTIPCYMKGLNKYELSEIKDIKIITEKGKVSTFYGANAANGCVIITTKK
ncbi:hypothetical protein L3049_09395 [Labilibaculum sp. DW002]|uniref:Uncharacterized protein n=1 Tax=Paralabilibaculum antarcticum TaxID=2912572 RepID=A0ABT5VS13_9BACT|nr:hypothetical protein [Labilibaculum sp. DW002]MDE5418224.1 hypothetical protein [Labilibaculum sp. DW002]